MTDSNNTLPNVFEFMRRKGHHADQMTEAEVRLLVGLKIAAESQPFLSTPLISKQLEIGFAQNSSESLPSQLLIICRRLAAFTPGVEYHPVSILLVASLVTNPVQCVIMALALAQETKRLGHTVGLDDLCFAMPEGYPIDAGYSAFWDIQKADNGGSHIDQPEHWV